MTTRTREVRGLHVHSHSHPGAARRRAHRAASPRRAASERASSIPGSCVESLPDAFRKLDPRVMVKSPVMFVVWIGSVLTTVFSFKDPGDWFGWTISAWLWLTVVFANLAEAVAEGRGKAQADTLRKAKTDTSPVALDRWHAKSGPPAPSCDRRPGGLRGGRRHSR